MGAHTRAQTYLITYIHANTHDVDPINRSFPF